MNDEEEEEEEGEERRQTIAALADTLFAVGH